MDITALSTILSQGKIQQDAAMQVQKLALDDMKEQGVALAKLMESVPAVTDPSLGNKINILA